jgi:flagellar motor switch protein FliM
MNQDVDLRPEEVSEVLANGSGDGDAAPEQDGRNEPKPFSLREPVAIPPEAEPFAKETLEKVVVALNEVVRSEADIECEMTLDGLQQQRSAAALSVMPAPVWVTALRCSGGGGLALALHPTVGLALVEAALGGSGSLPEEGREPTRLESRVLGWFFSRAADRLETLLGRKLSSAGTAIGEVPTQVASPGETMGVGLLRVKIGEQERSCLLMASAALLLPARKSTADKSSREPGPLAVKLDKVPLETRAVLQAGRVSLNDLMSMESGKVMRLDASEDSILELRVAGQMVAHGRIVRTGEQHNFAVERRVGSPAPEGRKE